MEEHWPDVLRALRAQKNWTQQDLATKLGTHATVVSSWERGKCRPTRVHREGIRELVAKSEGRAS